MSNAILSQVPLFSALPAHEIENLAATLQTVTLNPGDLLFHEAEVGDCSYVVLEGEIEIIKAYGGPDEFTVGFRGPGDQLGEMSLFDVGSLRSASARAHTFSRLFILTHTDFKGLIDRQPHLAYRIVQILTSRLRESNELALTNLRERNRRLSEAYESLKAAQAQVIEKEKLERELQLAYEMQSSLIPRSAPTLPGWDFATCWLPARNVSGDFFDFIRVNNKLGMVIADVADKGMAASLFMAVTRSTVRASVFSVQPPCHAISHANEILCEDASNGLFVTLFYAELNPITGDFVYVNAGHNPPFFYHAMTNEWTELYRTGLPLGLMEQELEQVELLMEPGDLFFMYTDGLTDAINPSLQEFGVERVRQLLRKHANSSAAEIVSAIESELKAHYEHQPLFDDVTFMVVKRY